MAVRQNPASLEQLLDAVLEKKLKVCQAKFENNYIGIQQALDDLRKDTKHVQHLKEKLDDLGKTKNHTQEWQTAEAESDITEDLHLQRKRGLESVLYISEIENAFMNVQDDFETRALYMAHRPEVFQSMYRDHYQPASHMHLECVEAMQKSWGWLSELNSCLGTHLNNAARYQQFCYDARHLEADLESYLEWLDSQPIHAPVKTRDPAVMTSHFCAILKHLLQLEGRVKKLCEGSRVVQPVHLRKHNTSGRPLQGEVLVDYQHRQISLQKHQTCMVVDNSDRERWRVLTADGQEAEVPSIIVVIPGPDPESRKTAYRLRSQMALNWATTAERLRGQLAQFIWNVSKDTHNRELAAVSTDQQAVLLHLMNECLKTLCGAYIADPIFSALKKELIRVRKLVAQIKPGAKAASNLTIKTWEGTVTTCRVFSDLLAYGHAYRLEIDQHLAEESILQNDLLCQSTYVSRAYFERTLPLVSIDMTTKRSQAITVQCLIYIHERNKGRQRETPALLCGPVMAGEAANHMIEPSTETTNVAIVGVRDPCKGHRMEAGQAIRKGILNLANGTYTSPDTGESRSIVAAIQQGLVLVEQGSGQSVDSPDGSMVEVMSLSSVETWVWPISGVLDPVSGEWLSTKDAISRGLIDPSSGTFHNPVSDHHMSLRDAISAGFLLTEHALLPTESAKQGEMFTSVAMVDVSHKVSGVLDLSTGNILTLQQGLQDNLVDPVRGTYRDSITGEVMSIEEALRHGFIQGKPFDPARDRDEGNVVIFQQLQIRQQRFVPPTASSIDSWHQDYHDQGPNEKLLARLLERLNFSREGVKDLSSGETISVQEACEKGIINLARAQFDTLLGEVIPIHESAACGYVELSLLKEILNVYQDCCLGNLIQQGKFDSDTGLVIDTTTGQTVSLETAINRKLIDTDMTFFFDIVANRILSLGHGVTVGCVNLTSGKVLVQQNDQELTVKDAEQGGYILASIDPIQLVNMAQTLVALRRVMDTKVQGIKLPVTGRLVDVEEAIALSLLHVPSVSYVHHATGSHMPLPVAIKKGSVEPQTALALLSALSKLSLHEAVQNGLLNPTTGCFLHPETGQSLDLATARQLGVWDPDLVFCVEKGDTVTSLGWLMDQGRFDAKSGKLRSATGDELLTLQEAIVQGVITSVLEPKHLLDIRASLKEMIDQGHVNPRSTIFIGPGDYRMSLRDALANGFLTLSSKVKQDSDSGDIQLAQDDRVVWALVKVKESTDWLADVECMMARQTRPSQRLQRLKEQIEETQGLRQEIRQKETQVWAAIQTVEGLKAGDVRQRDDTAQQMQKLKYNTADLRLRFDTASNEAECQETRLVCINSRLEEFYFQLEETDQWLDSAIERSQDLQASQKPVQEQLVAFRDFVEELKMKEDNMTKLMKAADEFKEQSLEFEREVEAYRKRLQVMPSIVEDGETGILDEEMESIESKFKDISRECSRHIDRLTSIVKNKKSFEDLNDRLASIYPKLQEQLAEVESHGLGHNQEKDKHHLESVRGIKAELIGYERKLKELTAAAERLIESLGEAGLASLADEIQKVVGDRTKQHSSLLEEVVQHEEQLDVSLSEQHNLASCLEAVLLVVQDAESRLQTKTGVSLDKDKLANQLQKQRLMAADLGSNRALLEHLAQEPEGVVAMDQQLAEVSDRLGAVEQLVEARARELEEVAADLGAFEARASDLAHWLGESFKEIKSSGRGTSGKAHWAKVHRLLESKDERAEELKDLHCMGQRLMDDDRVTHAYTVQETLGDMEGKWNELTEMLVKEVSFETVADVEGFLKYLDKAENDINTAEPISIDPEALRIQLRDHNAFHEDLTRRKNALKELIVKGRSLLHETANTKTEEIESRWDSIENQANLLCYHSADRQQQLESALPLALQLNENLSEVEVWLEEMEAELKAQSQGGDSLEEAKKQHDNIKMTQQIIDDHKLFIDDLNSTGMDLIDLCGVSEATDLHNKLLGVNTRYETLRLQARARGRELADKKRKLTQEVMDSLDQLLEDLDGLKRTVSTVDPVPVVPAKLKNEVDENMSVIQDLERMKPALLKAQEVAKDLKSYGIDDPAEAEDVKSRVAEIAQLSGNVGLTAAQRDKVLKQVLYDATQFFDLSTDVLASLRDLKDTLMSQQLPGVDTASIREQQSELAGIKTELEKAKELIGDCRRHAENVGHNCGEPGNIELRKQLEDLEQLADDVNDLVRDRGNELRKAYRHADLFSQLLEAVGSWLPLSEHKMASMRSPAPDIKELQEQLEEIKLFKSQVHPHIVEMQQLNQQLDALKDQSPVAAEALFRPVLAANEKWNDLLRAVADRETKLSDMLLKVGRVEFSMDDIICTLQQLQRDIKNQRNSTGDPKYLETILRKLQLMQSDIHNQEKTVRRLNKAVEDLVQKTDNVEYMSLAEKRLVMVDMLRATKAMAKAAENEVQDKMRQVKRFLGEVDRNLQPINDFRHELKNNLPFGALPETCEHQYNTFTKQCQELDEREKSVQALLAVGHQMVASARPEDVVQILEKIKRLQECWQDTREGARRRKIKMEEHRKNVHDFHNSLKAFTDWLNTTEVSMRAFVYPSKLVEGVLKQIEEHNAVRANLQAQSERMATLDKSGTYLKHFGRKQDTIYVKNLLVGIRLRWKKILCRTDERGRLLQQTYREDKRFHDAWQELCRWLDESTASLSRFLLPSTQTSLMKTEVEELKRFQMQLAARNATFYATTHLGRTLKDRCTKTDPERDILNAMLEEVRSKWNAVRTIISKRINKEVLNCPNMPLSQMRMSTLLLALVL